MLELKKVVYYYDLEKYTEGVLNGSQIGKTIIILNVNVCY